MQTLEALFRTLSRRRRYTRWWIGERPDARVGQLAKVIAGQVGLPTSNEDPFGRDQMVILDRAGAAHVLAVAGTTSLAHGRPCPSKGWVRDAKAALANLADDATFLSNGHWKEEVADGWPPLTSATFDCGVIGFDNDNAFIFWVEQED